MSIASGMGQLVPLSRPTAATPPTANPSTSSPVPPPAPPPTSSSSPSPLSAFHIAASPVQLQHHATVTTALLRELRPHGGAAGEDVPDVEDLLIVLVARSCHTPPIPASLLSCPARRQAPALSSPTLIFRLCCVLCVGCECRTARAVVVLPWCLRTARSGCGSRLAACTAGARAAAATSSRGQLLRHPTTPTSHRRAADLGAASTPATSSSASFLSACLVRCAVCRCDDSHLDDDPQPLSFSVSAQQAVHYLCLCKYTSSPPYCDGSHNHAIQGYEEVQQRTGHAHDAAHR